MGFFMIEYRNMKRYVSFLSLLIIAFGINFANASECVDDGCEIDEDIVAEEIAPEYETVGIIETTDVLEPEMPDGNLWFDDFDYDISANKYTCYYDYNCPFETATECAIWYRKPVYNETVAPRLPHLNPVKTDGILATLTFKGTISANDAMAKPLLERYQILMRASRACCTEGIIHQLRTIKTKDKKIYNFLKDDANRFAVGARCLVTSNEEIYDSYSYGVTGDMVAAVRNSCLCKNRQWFDTLLEPFYDLYQLAPEFEQMPFYYTYLDGFQREITVSVNDDVQSVLELLQYCPD